MDIYSPSREESVYYIFKNGLYIRAQRNHHKISKRQEMNELVNMFFKANIIY